MKMNDDQLQAFACEIAKKCGWSSQIIDLFQRALEDANFHTFNRHIDDLRQKLGE